MTANNVPSNSGLLDATSAFQQQNFPNAQQQQQQQGYFQQLGQLGQQVVSTQNDNLSADITHQSTKRAHRAEPVQSSTTTSGRNSDLPNSVAMHLPLLRHDNADGAILRSYYELSANEVLNLPPVPTDEEYCARLNAEQKQLGYHPYNLPTYDQSALQAARFSELALGALANGQTPLALELSNASVMCLRNCVEEPSHKSCMYDVARAYLLHGILRSFRGDMVRYFKYRRVCMTHILQLTVSDLFLALVCVTTKPQLYVSSLLHQYNNTLSKKE
jgi:hypothetical protein